MDSVETIVGLATRFYELAKLAKANKEQCEAIAKRIQRLVRRAFHALCRARSCRPTQRGLHLACWDAGGRPGGRSGRAWRHV